MRLAYKAFAPDLSCTSGGNKFQYRKDGWNEEPEANCRKNGLHCAANPLDCLSYYPDWQQAVYYIVGIEGEMHEDGYDSKISCTRMKLIKELDMEDFVAHTLLYISNHPTQMIKSRYLVMESGVVQNLFLIVRGRNPIAKGKEGDIVGLVEESDDGKEISAIACYQIGQEGIPEDTWFDINGKALL